MTRYLLLLILVVAASACTVLPERDPVDLYQLPPSSLSRQSGTALTGGLRVARPSTSDALGGSRILVMESSNHRFQAYPTARWSAPVPQLWRDWLLDAIWRDGRISQASISSDNLGARLELSGMLRALHVEQVESQHYAVIRYDAQLINLNTRSIAASRRFESREPLGNVQAAVAVSALGVAADRLATELIEWIVQQSGNQS